MHVVTSHAVPNVGRAVVTSRLDDLLIRSAPELQSLYVNASTPRLEDVGGALRGRMLAWPALEAHPLATSALRSIASVGSFPWRGKTFTPHARRGEGINRVFSERFRLFRFETFIAKSRAGDFEALQLDYDLPGNPPVIRSVKDEIRELEPGLWLGQAYLQTARRDRLWLYFGLAKP
ncbi:hypothetical protein AKJ09_00540 [Labilithrix luteola]|uniref:Uncharacterized protein n=1 Tax=Labilithrix luteola TaxID=1391654 RepID=A0A0K1PKF8_9BACT|nr:hypothetical protein [Labilithrix luteola]AKU93876.1 hypothetical protein AKJ09_00540 [Labilithrix luteola]